eukprot:TRINITY_DN16477_c0_g1_i1.p1 TRINITY_DN16477_c0_g1~~TRINITY_DN16477_c0_g1_i1.p1  ORF type:complete len:680 (+),score=176.78 TRINITY_DN16477_c0_g1_i1:54-2042(+)
MNSSPSPRRASSLGEVTIDMLFKQTDENKREMRCELRTLRGLCENDMRTVFGEMDETKGRVDMLEEVVAMQGSQGMHDLYDALIGQRSGPSKGGVAEDICNLINRLIDNRIESTIRASPTRSRTGGPQPQTPTYHAIEQCREALTQHQRNMDQFEAAVRHDQGEIVKAVRDLGMKQRQIETALHTRSPSRSPRGAPLSIEEVFPSHHAHSTEIASFKEYIEGELKLLSSSVEASRSLFLTSNTEFQSELVTLSAKVERSRQAGKGGELALLRQDLTSLTAAVDALQSTRGTATPPTTTPPAEPLTPTGAGSIRQRRALESKIESLQQEIKTVSSAVRKAQLSDKMLKELKNEVTVLSADVMKLKEAADESQDKDETASCSMKDFNKLASKVTSDVAILKDQMTVMEGLADHMSNDLDVVKSEMHESRGPPPSPVDDGRVDSLRDEMQKTVNDLSSEINGIKEDRVTSRAWVEGQMETISAAVEGLQASAQSPLRDASPHTLFNAREAIEEVKAGLMPLVDDVAELASEVDALKASFAVTDKSLKGELQEVQEQLRLAVPDTQLDASDNTMGTVLRIDDMQKELKVVKETSLEALNTVIDLANLPATVDTMRSELDTIQARISAKRPAPVSIDSVPSTSCGGFTSIASPKASSPPSFEQEEDD